jgi:hypothetical protein
MNKVRVLIEMAGWDYWRVGMIQCVCLSCLADAPFVDVLLARPFNDIKVEGDKVTYSNFS